MDKEVQECLFYLQQNASEVRQLGKEWGMTDAEINRCVVKAMKTKIDDAHQICPDEIAVKFKRRKSWNRVRWVAQYTVVLTGLLLCVAATGATVLWCRGTPLFMMTPGRLLQPYAYQIMKVVRIFGPPLHSVIPMMSDYHTEECIVKNPLWENRYLDCDACSFSAKITEYKQIRPKDEHVFFNFPVIYRNVLPHVVTLEDVQSVILSSKTDLSKPVQSTTSWSRTAIDFANNVTGDKISKSHGFQFHWKSDQNLAVGRLMRTLFPRPLMFTDDMEVSVKKYLHVDGPASAGYTLPNWEGIMAWYAQGFGVRSVTLTPVHACRDRCYSLQVNVTQKDILIYPDEYWEVSLLPSDKLSISYMGGCEYMTTFYNNIE